MSDDKAAEAKTFTQDDVNEIVRDRLARQAKKFEDYDELKAKVEQYEATLSNSETEMADLKSKVADLTAKAAKTEREALVARIARDNGITDSEDIALFLTGADEDTLSAQAARLASRNAADAEANKAAEAEARRANAYVPTEGQTPPTPAETSSDEALALAIGKALGQVSE